MRQLWLAAIILAALAAPAAAAPCGAGGQGEVAVHYETGKTKLTAEHRAKLAKFAKTAKHKTAVCVFAQVDAQGSEEANKRVADARARNVKDFLISQGVRADIILVKKQDKAFTLFGLLDEDTKNDRRVSVSYE